MSAIVDTCCKGVPPALATCGFEVDKVRQDFPLLSRKVHGKPLAYLDNAATTQKPQFVIDAITRFYQEECANIHRAVHLLSEEATQAYEGARVRIQRFLNARESREVIFVRGATEGINLVAATFGKQRIGPGDEVIITAMEHHSNIVPWQLLCQERGAKLVVAPINDKGELLLDQLEKLFTERTKMLNVVHVSNALGTVNPIKKIVAMAHAHGVPVLVDGAQGAPHLKVDVQDMNCDFYVLSAHKMFGPMGIGVLYGKKELLEEMPPYQSGGDMILSVTFERTTFNSLPYKFEAGTPDVAGAVGFGAAIAYLEKICLTNVAQYERELVDYCSARLLEIPGVRIVGTAEQKAAVVSFVVDNVHPHDIGTFLDQDGVAIRTGHHCAQPVMKRFGIPATSRASFAFYNTKEEIDRLAASLRNVIEVFR